MNIELLEDLEKIGVPVPRSMFTKIQRRESFGQFQLAFLGVSLLLCGFLTLKLYRLSK